MSGFRNPSPQAIRELLDRARTLAVVGLSDDPARPSFGVSRSMREMGYRILPVNPSLREWQGVPAFATIAAAAAALVPGEHIDIVNVFRRPAQVDAVVDECIALGIGALWLQQGVINEPAAARAVAAGMTVVMDRCIYVDRVSLRG
jgi:predicted CoA-binding protein